MDTKALFAPLFAGAMVLGLAGVAQADPIYLDFSAGGGVDGHVDRDGATDPDQVTETFNQLGVFANTTTTQFDTDGSSTRSEEHTSELQSLMRISYAVFCLKKKKTKYDPLKQHQQYR